jgi:hypothetical protein
MIHPRRLGGLVILGALLVLPARAGTQGEPVTWSNQVSRLVQDHCQGCGTRTSP